MKNIVFFTCVFSIFFFLYCNTDSAKYSSESVIADLIQKFPQLPRGKGNQTAFYEHIRTVSFGNNGLLQLQLWATPDSVEEKQQILILINEKKEPYALPLFSNLYKSYWNFEFEVSPTDTSTYVNTTFQKEFTSAFDSLGFTEKPKVCLSILAEFLLSIMRTEVVREQDSLDFKEVVDRYVRNKSYAETRNSCILRQQKTFNEILKEIRPNESYHRYNACWDKQNHRIYQIVNTNPNNSVKYNCLFKIYRQDCNHWSVGF